MTEQQQKITKKFYHLFNVYQNTTINDRTKISPAQILYGNAIHMDEGILIPRGEVNLIPENITISSTNMISYSNCGKTP